MLTMIKHKHFFLNWDSRFYLFKFCLCIIVTSAHHYINEGSASKAIPTMILPNPYSNESHVFLKCVYQLNFTSSDQNINEGSASWTILTMIMQKHFLKWDSSSRVFILHIPVIGHSNIIIFMKDQYQMHN